MKKFILPIFVALMATVAFNSCKDDTDEMTDADLKVALQNKVFTGSNSTGAYTLNLASSTFELDEPNTTDGDGTVWDNISKGNWDVVQGKLILTITSIDGSSYVNAATVTIEKEGERLQFPTFDGATYSGPVVQLDVKK